MSWSTEFESLMPDTVTVSAVSGVSTDGYGTETYAAASTYKARYVRKQKLIRTFQGTEELTTSQLYIASTSTFDGFARIVLNGSTLGPLMGLDAIPDEDGVHHVVAYFG